LAAVFLRDGKVSESALSWLTWGLPASSPFLAMGSAQPSRSYLSLGKSSRPRSGPGRAFRQNSRYRTVAGLHTFGRRTALFRFRGCTLSGDASLHLAWSPASPARLSLSVAMRARAPGLVLSPGWS
jgi:hypothetical protein